MGYEAKKIPKAISSDLTGDKKVGVSKVDREYGGAPSTTGGRRRRTLQHSSRAHERWARTR